MEFWNILKHETPGTSERKFVKTLELISKMRGRVCKLKICKWFITSANPDLILQYGVIKRTHFGRTSKE